MGLRCLIGHDFGEVQTDREREERGEEVLVTVTEYRECDRCGYTRVLSENKEVRTTAPDPDPEDSSESRGPSAVDAGDDLEDVSAEEDDGVILREVAEESGERQRGEWPARDEEADDADGEPEDPTPWPEVEGEDEGYTAEPSGGGPAEDVDFGGGLTPESAAVDADASPAAEEQDEVIEATDDRGSSGIRRAQPSPGPTGRQREVDPDARFYCPECEHTAPSDGSSLRPGDICPECRLGYLTERTG